MQTLEHRKAGREAGIQAVDKQGANKSTDKHADL